MEQGRRLIGDYAAEGLITGLMAEPIPEIVKAVKEMCRGIEMGSKKRLIDALDYVTKAAKKVTQSVELTGEAEKVYNLMLETLGEMTTVDAWEVKYISKGQMPPANQYVLIYVSGRPWRDSDDLNGAFWKIAKCIYGISMAERRMLAESKDRADQERAKVYYAEDEQCNNRKHYHFKEFGPGTYFGQEVDMWCHLPGCDR